LLNAGSVIVKFEISGNGDEDGDEKGADKTSSVFVEELQKQLKDKESLLFKGELTSKTKTEVAVKVEELPMPVEIEEEKKKKKQKEFKKMVGKGLTVGKVITRTESRRLMKWVWESPTILHALSFLCGVMLLFSSVFGFIMDLYSGQFSAFMINFCLILFAVLIIVTEAKVKAFETFAGPSLRSYMQVFNKVEGRGVWLRFVGILAMSLESKGSWQNYLSFGSGFLSFIVGAISVGMGKLAGRKTSALKEQLHDEKNVRADQGSRQRRKRFS